MKDFDDSWSLRLGEVNITDGGNQFILVVGYPLTEDKKNLYVRLYDSEENFIFGKWITNVIDKKQVVDSMVGDEHKYLISGTLIEKIKEQVARLEQLKVFV